MMRGTKKIFILLGISVLLVSCNPASQYKTEIAQIDSCLTRLDSLETIYDGIDFDSLNYMYDHVIDNEKLIKELYKPDTLNEELGRDMNDSKAIRKRLNSIRQDEMIYGDELNAVKHQFMDLKEDILNGVLSEEQITSYIGAEIAALKKVDDAFTAFCEMIKMEKERYYMVVPDVDEFIEVLKTESDSTN